MTNSKQTTSFPESEVGLAKVTQGWAIAYNEMDAAKTASFFAEDAILYPQNAPMAKGVTAIEAVMRDVFSLGKMDFTLTPIASLRSGDIAYQTVAYVQKITPATGSPIEDRGEAVIIMKRIGDDEWRIVHDMYNSDLPGAD